MYKTKNAVCCRPHFLFILKRYYTVVDDGPLNMPNTNEIIARTIKMWISPLTE